MLDVDNSKNVYNLREQYKNFYYRNYEIIDNIDDITIKYFFSIEGLKDFITTIRIVKKDYIREDIIGNNKLNNLAFHLGMIELLSYLKSCMCPNIIIECGSINSEQEKFYKKLYYNGLGELLYRNNINIKMDDLFNFTSLGNAIDDYESDNYSGYLIPIGGGKDSIVTLENLDLDTNRDLCFVMNPKTPQLEECGLRGFSDSNIVEVYRSLDKELLNLNNEGFINGHTPLSACISFVTYLVAYLTNKKYIVLSNESSASDVNIEGTNINHQYSKSLEYENDFREFSSNYLHTGSEYFSLLRGLNELEITKLFSKYSKYHHVFKSCNLGSKQNPWIWCTNCPKCVFVYIMLSAFINQDKMIEIFGENLFEKASLKEIFVDLTGYGKLKPFECVGTFDEVRYAISKAIDIYETRGLDLPLLLQYYKENYPEVDLNSKIITIYDDNNNIPEYLNNILKEVIKND